MMLQRRSKADPSGQGCPSDSAEDNPDGAAQRHTLERANVGKGIGGSLLRWCIGFGKPTGSNHPSWPFKLSNDPRFVEKLVDMVGLYVNPPEHALVLCADEKSQIQALDHTQPGLPMKKG